MISSWTGLSAKSRTIVAGAASRLPSVGNRTLTAAFSLTLAESRL